MAACSEPSSISSWNHRMLTARTHDVTPKSTPPTKNQHKTRSPAESSHPDGPSLGPYWASSRTRTQRWARGLSSSAEDSSCCVRVVTQSRSRWRQIRKVDQKSDAWCVREKNNFAANWGAAHAKQLDAVESDTVHTDCGIFRVSLAKDDGYSGW